MSLQRVLEIARKNGMPVIVTDNSGQEPMVILPLEQFEALTQTQSSQCSVLSAQPARRSPLMTDGGGSKDSALGTRHSEIDDAIAEMSAERLKDRVEETAVQLESLADQESESPEISLEERFYLEPDETA